MSTRRTTHDKRERERARQVKAAQKRERRHERANDVSNRQTAPADYTTASTDELLDRIRHLHNDYDAGGVSFEDFDSERAILLDAVAASLAG
jgi:hypothetical protein